MGSRRVEELHRVRKALFPLKPAERRKPQIKRTGPVRTLKPEEMIAVEGQKLSMPYRFAKCCALLTASPRPEKITGVVTRNGFISVHRTGCRMIKSANPERTVKMKWIG
jgi:(p)ppGpp synthase/HD superfamily hydrolase